MLDWFQQLIRLYPALSAAFLAVVGFSSTTFSAMVRVSRTTVFNTRIVFVKTRALVGLSIFSIKIILQPSVLLEKTPTTAKTRTMIVVRPQTRLYFWEVLTRMKILWKYIRPHRSLIFIALLLAAAAQLLNLLDPVIFGIIIDRYTGKTMPL